MLKLLNRRFNCQSAGTDKDEQGDAPFFAEVTFSKSSRQYTLADPVLRKTRRYVHNDNGVRHCNIRLYPRSVQSKWNEQTISPEIEWRIPNVTTPTHMEIASKWSTLPDGRPPSPDEGRGEPLQMVRSEAI